MKKIIFLLIIVIFTSCGIYKKTKTQVDTNTKITGKDTTIYVYNYDYKESVKYINVEDTSKLKLIFKCDSNYKVVLDNYFQLNSKYNSLVWKFNNGNLEIFSIIDSLQQVIIEKDLRLKELGIKSKNFEQEEEKSVKSKSKFNIGINTFTILIILIIVLLANLYLIIKKR